MHGEMKCKRENEFQDCKDPDCPNTWRHINPLSKIIIHFDGSFVPKWNLMGFGYVIQLHDGVKFENFGSVNYFMKTNNVSEYMALIKSLETCISMRIGLDSELMVKGDSELVVKQLNGEYKCRKKHLIPLYNTAKRLCTKFKNVSFQHIPRTSNTEADKLSKKAISSKVWLSSWDGQ